MRRNFATLLTGAACIGVVTTAIVSAINMKKAMKAETKKEAVKAFIPTAVIGTLTVVSIIGSHRINKRQIAMLTATAAMSVEQLQRYKNGVREVLGEEAHQKVVDHVIKQKCNPPDIWVPGVLGDANVLVPNNMSEKEPIRTFYDSYSKQYFESTLSKVIEAQYHYNRDYVGRGEVAHKEYYEYLGISPPKEDVGFNVSGGLWWLDFNNRVVTLDDGMEVIVIDVVYGPDEDYREE